MEIEALKATISEELKKTRNWLVLAAGQVKEKDGQEVYQRGYVTSCGVF